MCELELFRNWIFLFKTLSSNILHGFFLLLSLFIKWEVIKTKKWSILRTMRYSEYVPSTCIQRFLEYYCWKIIVNIQVMMFKNVQVHRKKQSMRMCRFRRNRNMIMCRCCMSSKYYPLRLMYFSRRKKSMKIWIVRIKK